MIPSPTTTNQCHRLHGSRSRRRGIIVSTTGPVSRPSVALTAPAGRAWPFRTRWKPAAVSALLSTSRHIQPWPLSGLAFVGAADGREDASASELPFLDLVVVALDVGAELTQVFEEAVLGCREPGLGRIAVGVDAAQVDQVVLELLEDQGIDVALGLVPVGLLAGARHCARSTARPPRRG